jgi:Protein of unknown function (DUF4236)
VALRFRRSVKLAPGLRLNLSGSGTSLTVGPRGASVSFGSRGAFLNSGLPGTGLYSRSRLGAAPSQPSRAPEKVIVSAEVRVEDDGTVKFLDSSGQPLTDYLTNLAKRQQGDQIREMLQETSARINAETDSLGKIHCFTPSPTETPIRAKRTFEKQTPQFPTAKPVTFLARLLGKHAEIDAHNAELRRLFDEECSRWESEKALFDANENEESEKFARLLHTDAEFMQQVLEDNLQDIVWPRENLVSFEVRNGGRSVDLDVDLPEIEDLPRRLTSVPERGYKLTTKELKGKALQELYARHVHGIGFRIIGEVFATLPTVEQVSLSAFTQRDDNATGQRLDTYIYSVRVPRSEWTKLNFKNLPGVDVAACFDRLELRRKIGRNGVFAPIEPFDAS